MLLFLLLELVVLARHTDFGMMQWWHVDDNHGDEQDFDHDSHAGDSYDGDGDGEQMKMSMTVVMST